MRRQIGWFPFFLLFLGGCCAGAGPLVRVPAAPDVRAGLAEKVVNWYTSLRGETAAGLIEAFQEKHSIRVAIFQGSDPALVSRFLRERQGPKANADVLQLTDPGLFAGLKQRGLLRPAEVPNGLKVPSWLRGSGGFWVASHVVTAVLAYRPDRLKTGSVPRSWSDLADARFRNRLIVPDPAESGPAFYWAAAMARLHGWGFLEALGRNAAAVLPYHEAAGGLAAGQAWVSGGLSGEEVWRAGRAGRPVTLGIPAEGVPAIPAAAALPKGAPHPAAGAAFLNFLLSPPAQRILAGDGFYPALPGVRAPAGRTALKRLRLL
ncbi:MAG: extracellular solute-binding protein, partial [Nitrospinota bacterium]|nr:extracellular solute-binding protein [Nitrospinota bacterium]